MDESSEEESTQVGGHGRYWLVRQPPFTGYELLESEEEEKQEMIADFQFWDFNVENYVLLFWENDPNVLKKCVEYGMCTEVVIPADAADNKKNKSKQSRLERLRKLRKIN